MLNSVFDMAMFMLYIVILGLILTNAGSFNSVMNTLGDNWRSTLSTLQNP